MVDIGDTILAKSDQLNADDLLGGPITVTITRVQVLAKGADQPVLVHYEGGEGRPWKPSKGMRRLLVACWGSQSADYVGRQVCLFREPTVKWGGEEVGGIQIRAVSHIDRPVTTALQVKKGQKAKFTVQPLQARQQQQRPEPTQADARQAIMDAVDVAALDRVWASRRMDPFREQLQAEHDQRRGALTPREDAPDEGGFDAP